jgi:hypothetical protein
MFHKTSQRFQKQLDTNCHDLKALPIVRRRWAVGGDRAGRRRPPNPHGVKPRVLSLTLALTTMTAAPPFAAGQQPGTFRNADWSRVIELAPGTEIVVTTRGSSRASRVVVAANDSDLTVIDANILALPPAARSVLRDQASTHPEYFLAAQSGSQFVFENDVRLGRDGVFVAGRKVADVAQLIETVARKDVAEIRGPVRVRGSVHGAILGTWFGSAVGLTFGTQASSASLGWSLLTGFTVLGAFLGYHASSHMEQGVIYRAP